MIVSLSPFAPETFVSPDAFGSPVQPAHLHTQAASGAYLRGSLRVPRRRPFIYFKPPYAIGPVPRVSGRAFAYRWRSLPRVCRHRVSKPQNRHTLSGQSRVYRVTHLLTDGVHCRESSGTGTVNLKVVPNGCCLGRSP